GEGQRERKPDVSQADDSDERRTLLDSRQELRRTAGKGNGCGHEVTSLDSQGFAPLGVRRNADTLDAKTGTRDARWPAQATAVRVPPSNRRVGRAGIRTARSNSTATVLRSIVIETTRRRRAWPRRTTPEYPVKGPSMIRTGSPGCRSSSGVRSAPDSCRRRN